MSHFDEMTCMLYLDGQLERERAAKLAAHVAACAECRALLEALEREVRLLREALVEEDEAVPARLLEPPVRESVPWAWLTAFGLAGGGAYTLWTGIIEPWREQLGQVGFGEGNLLALLFFQGVFWKGWEAMMTSLETMALATLGIVVLTLLGRTWRHLPRVTSGQGPTIAVMLGLLAVALALPSPAGAAEVKKADFYTLATGEVVKNDLILIGGTVRIDGTVEGDLIVLCRSLTLTGHVTGDVIGFAQYLRIGGQVDGDVRAFSNTLGLNGIVGKNVSAFVQSIDLEPNAKVDGSLTLFGADVSLNGRVGRDLMSYAANATLNGFVGGNARLQGAQLSIGPAAEIQGKAKFRGRKQPEVSPQAKLASPLEVEIVKHKPDYAKPRFYWRQALMWGASFVFGLVCVLLMPVFFKEVVQSGNRYGMSAIAGLASLIGVPIVALILCITIVGLAVGIGALLLYAIATFATCVVVGSWLGQKVLGEASSVGAMLGRLAFGLLVLRVLYNVPYAGGIIELVVLVWGLGALTLAIYNRVKPVPALA